MPIEDFLKNFKPKRTEEAAKQAREEIASHLADNPNAAQEEIEQGYEKNYGRPKQMPKISAEIIPGQVGQELRLMDIEVSSWNARYEKLYGSENMTDALRIKTARNILKDIAYQERHFQNSWRSFGQNRTVVAYEKYETLMNAIQDLKGKLEVMARGQLS